jgi:ketosteroid isomerase-like protein
VQEVRTPAEASYRFAEAISAGDLEGALECWSPAAVIVAPDGSEVRGRSALAQRFGQLVAAGAQAQVLVFDEVRTDIGATARTRMSLTVPVDGKPITLNTAGVVTYVPGQSGWRILIDRLHSEGEST